MTHRETEKEARRREPERGACPGIVYAEKESACEAEPGLELVGLSGSLPSGHSPITRWSARLVRASAQPTHPLLLLLLPFLPQTPPPPPASVTLQQALPTPAWVPSLYTTASPLQL